MHTLITTPPGRAYFYAGTTASGSWSQQARIKIGSKLGTSLALATSRLPQSVTEVEAVVGDATGSFYLLQRQLGVWTYMSSFACPATCPAQYGGACINSLALDSGFAACSSPYTGSAYYGISLH